MDFFKGLGKAGTGILGGVVQGAGKAVETVGHVAESAPIVGGVVGGVVSGTGKVIEKTGEATEHLGDALFGEKKPKQMKTTDGDPVDGGQDHDHVDDVNERPYIPYIDDFNDLYVSLAGDEEKVYYDDTLEDLMAYDQEQARLKEEASDGEGEKRDE